MPDTPTRWCQLARAVTLIVDLVPADQQDRAECLVDQMLDIAGADITDAYREGVKDARPHRRPRPPNRSADF